MHAFLENNWTLDLVVAIDPRDLMGSYLAFGLTCSEGPVAIIDTPAELIGRDAATLGLWEMAARRVVYDILVGLMTHPIGTLRAILADLDRDALAERLDPDALAVLIHGPGNVAPYFEDYRFSIDVDVDPAHPGEGVFTLAAELSPPGLMLSKSAGLAFSTGWTNRPAGEAMANGVAQCLGEFLDYAQVAGPFAAVDELLGDVLKKWAFSPDRSAAPAVEIPLAIARKKDAAARAIAAGQEGGDV